MKLLHWSAQGFNLYYKRLETGTFELFNYDIEFGYLHLDYSQLVLLIDGISIKNISSKNRFLPPK